MCEGVGRVVAPDCVRPLADAWLVSYRGIRRRSQNGGARRRWVGRAASRRRRVRAACPCRRPVDGGVRCHRRGAADQPFAQPSQLSELLGRPVRCVSTVMRGRPCVWAGEGAACRRRARASTVATRCRSTCARCPLLSPFTPLLTALGVRDTFAPRDFLHDVCFKRDHDDSAAAPQLEACVRALRAAAPADGGGADRLSLPSDEDATLRPAAG